MLIETGHKDLVSAAGRYAGGWAHALQLASAGEFSRRRSWTRETVVAGCSAAGARRGREASSSRLEDDQQGSGGVGRITPTFASTLFGTAKCFSASVWSYIPMLSRTIR